MSQLVLELIIFVLYLLSQNIFVLCKYSDLLQGFAYLTVQTEIETKT